MELENDVIGNSSLAHTYKSHCEYNYDRVLFLKTPFKNKIENFNGERKAYSSS